MYHITTITGHTILVKNARDQRHAAYATNERLKRIFQDNVFWKIVEWTDGPTAQGYDFLIDCDGSGILDCRSILPPFMVN